MAGMRSIFISLALLLTITAAWVVNSKPAEFQYGINDYVQLYGGATLIGSSRLYDPAAMYELQAKTLGGIMPNVLYVRPPFEALLMRPLAALPYRTSYWCFQAICLIAITAFMWIFHRTVPEVVALTGVSFPLACAFLNGQDISLVLLSSGCGILLLRRNRRLAAGLVFALCAVKFHLFGLVAIGFLIRREWRVLAGGLTGLSALAFASFWAAGPDWPARYLHALANPVINPNTLEMGNVYSLAYGYSPSLEWTYAPLLILVIGAFLFLAWRDSSCERVVTYGLAGGLLVGRHSFCHDFSLLLLAYAVLYTSPELIHREWLRWICLPFLYLGLILQNVFSAALPLSLIALLGWFCWRMRPAANRNFLADETGIAGMPSS
jgi:hypothetical protein